MCIRDSLCNLTPLWSVAVCTPICSWHCTEQIVHTRCTEYTTRSTHKANCSQMSTLIIGWAQRTLLCTYLRVRPHFEEWSWTKLAHLAMFSSQCKTINILFSRALNSLSSKKFQALSVLSVQGALFCKLFGKTIFSVSCTQSDTVFVPISDQCIYLSANHLIFEEQT